MLDSRTELLGLADTLSELAERGRKDRIQQPLQLLASAVGDVEKAWSGSWLGYHANVYYRDLGPPPPGAHFNKEYGINPSFTRGSTGDWVEYNAEHVQNTIYEAAGNPNIADALTYRDEVASLFDVRKMDILSIIDVELKNSGSEFLGDLQEKVSEVSLATDIEVLYALRPKQTVSRDTNALGHGFWTPPHISIKATILSIQHAVGATGNLSKFARLTASHIARERQATSRPASGKRVFIGHGRSPLWRELKEFVEDRLKLPADEFNRVPIAGVSNKERLSADVRWGCTGTPDDDGRR